MYRRGRAVERIRIVSHEATQALHGVHSAPSHDRLGKDAKAARRRFVERRYDFTDARIDRAENEQPRPKIPPARKSQMSDVTSIPGWQDMTAAELVAFGAANPQTATPYPVDELINWLRENRLARYDTAGGWEGLLVVIAQNEQTPLAFREGLKDMLSHLRNPKSVQVDTHLDSYAPLLGALLASTGLTSEQIAEFYERDGGRKYPLFTSEAEATAAKAAAINAEDEAGHRQQAKVAGARFGNEFAIGGDAGAAMEAIWAEVTSGN